MLICRATGPRCLGKGGIFSFLDESLPPFIRPFPTTACTGAKCLYSRRLFSAGDSKKDYITMADRRHADSRHYPPDYVRAACTPL